jgi:hypothetical protein
MGPAAVIGKSLFTRARSRVCWPPRASRGADRNWKAQNGSTVGLLVPLFAPNGKLELVNEKILLECGGGGQGRGSGERRRTVFRNVEGGHNCWRNCIQHPDGSIQAKVRSRRTQSSRSCVVTSTPSNATCEISCSRATRKRRPEPVGRVEAKLKTMTAMFPPLQLAGAWCPRLRRLRRILMHISASSARVFSNSCR